MFADHLCLLRLPIFSHVVIMHDAVPGSFGRVLLSLKNHAFALLLNQIRKQLMFSRQHCFGPIGPWIQKYKAHSHISIIWDFWVWPSHCCWARVFLCKHRAQSIPFLTETVFPGSAYICQCLSPCLSSCWMISAKVFIFLSWIMTIRCAAAVMAHKAMILPQWEEHLLILRHGLSILFTILEFAETVCTWSFWFVGKSALTFFQLVRRKVLLAILALVDHVLLQVVGESLDASLTADEQCTEDEGVDLCQVISHDWTKEKLRES